MNARHSSSLRESFQLAAVSRSEPSSLLCCDYSQFTDRDVELISLLLHAWRDAWQTCVGSSDDAWPATPAEAGGVAANSSPSSGQQPPSWSHLSPILPPCSSSHPPCSFALPLSSSPAASPPSPCLHSHPLSPSPPQSPPNH